MTLLALRDVSVCFPVRGRGDWPWTRPRLLRAVAQVSLDLAEGETLGIVGESGSGKSTLARAIVGTVPVSGGQVLWQGGDLGALSPRARRQHRREVQMVFQDPLAALNPRMTVGQIVAEPLRTHRPELSGPEVARQVGEILERVGLLPGLTHRYPHEFSGGQCQRIGIARALILRPRLLVCDEPVSALDVSVQAQVINLLGRLQREFGLAMMFIAHDLSVVRHVSARIAVMYLGRLVEVGPAEALIAAPRHPYTRALIRSVPVPDPVQERQRRGAALTGELPSPLSPPSGCAFRTRCPVAQRDCADRVPDLAPAGARHQVACPHAPGGSV